MRRTNDGDGVHWLERCNDGARAVDDKVSRILYPFRGVIKNLGLHSVSMLFGLVSQCLYYDSNQLRNNRYYSRFK